MVWNIQRTTSGYHVEMTGAPPPAVDTSAQAIMDLEREYVLQNYARYPLVLARGKGCHVFDLEGRRYLDFIAGIGVNALGHAHPRILKVIRDQAALLIHSSNLYYHPYQGPLAKRLAEASGLQRAFFASTGTEAMEGALKMAHAHGRAIHPDKFEILSLENSFHGRTLGALSVTGQLKYREPFEPLIPGVRFVPPNDVAALEAAFNERTAAIVLEMIQGEGGIYPLSPEFAAKARELATRYNALLIADEIQCGVGRPGTYFAYQRAKPVILPDVMVAAKPLACGLPLAVIMANEKAAAAIKPGMHGTTFGGGALACRVALEFFDILDELLPDIQRVGGYFHVSLNELARKHSFVKEVRGFGLMLGMELTIPGKQIVLDAIPEGLLINCTHDKVLRFLPPYIITEKEVDQAVKVLAKLFAKVK
jgi:acetylornithine/N-succinyldiaminopimelate aminotransferase